jgi:hypothetical protein
MQAIMMDSKVHTVLRYLEPVPMWEEIKPYQVVGRLNEGQSRNNLVLSEHQVEIEDVKDVEPAPSLDTSGFLYGRCDTGETLSDKESIDRHIMALEAWLRDTLGLSFVKTFEYRVSTRLQLADVLSADTSVIQLRKRHFDPAQPSIRPVSNFVHIGNANRRSHENGALQS